MRSGRIGFWDVQIDQYLMSLLPGYLPLSLARLQRLAGAYAIERAFGSVHINVGPHGRHHFLHLDEAAFLDIQKHYPGYRYLMTENRHLDFPKLHENGSFTLYRIEKLRAPSPKTPQIPPADDRLLDLPVTG